MHGIPASKSVPFMPSRLLRLFRFNIPFLLFRLCPYTVSRFLHIPRAAPEYVLPPFRMPVYPFPDGGKVFPVLRKSLFRSLILAFPWRGKGSLAV